MKRKSLTKNYIYNSLYQVFAILIPLLTTPYIARILKPENVGINSYVNSVVTLFTTIGLMGLSNYSVREVAYVRGDQQKLNKVFSELLILRLIYFVFTIFVYLIYAHFSSYSLYYYIYIFTIIGAFFDVAWLFQGLEELGITILRSFIIKLVGMICIFVFVRKESDLEILMLIYSLTTIFSAITLYIPTKKIITKLELKNLEIIKHVIPNLKLFLPQVATLIYCQFDKIMINDLSMDIKQVGFYNQAEKIVKVPLAVVTSLSAVMLPRISEEYIKNNSDNVKKYIISAFKVSLALSIPLSIGLAAISYGLIPWFLGNEYIDTAYILIALGITTIFISISNVSGAQYLTAINNTKVLTVSYFCGAGINVILNFIFIPKYKALGATIGTIAAELLVALIQIVYMKKIIKLRELIKISKNYIIASILMCLVCSSMYFILKPSIILTSIQICIGGAVYFFMLYIFKDETFEKYGKKILKKVGGKI